MIAAFTSNMKGISIANVIGVNPDVDTATVPEAVIANGGTYTFLSSEQTLEVVSDSAQDAAAGTGARTVRVDLLDASYAPFSVNVSMNGTTPVAVSGGTYLRVNDMRITGVVGSSDSNVGNITLRVAGGGQTISYMLAGKGRSQQAVYTVPAGRTAYATHTKVNIIRAKQSADAEIELQSRAQGGGWVVRNTVQASSQGNTADVSDPPFPPPFFEKSDIRFVVTNVSVNDVAVQAVMQMILAEDTVRLPSHSLMRELRLR